ncbi:hypothetical protein FH609_014255 [Streptomyces sp. 3MP-14]|uniref:DUF2269 family protein n=1 Tax=Streptomyces mimosae TaxID=2586635 RepID=A0A5N5ZYK4_9ACTN|nr:MULTISPECIES: hypothetical protein [Streptomyces]KAB8160198.1 hypothetical protein FH607_027855 [Streptomyces mimosae]KAB8176633.1 hypothetical protein FH609_014255 [Streptomyces sp. 3MP-14]
MAKLLLSLHVLAAILTVGPITVAASLFPRYARQAAATHAETEAPPGLEPEHVPGAEAVRSGAIAATLHRICRGYAAVGIAVPVFGLATGAQLGVLTDAWLLASLALTALAAALLVVVILPRQEDLLPEDPPAERRASGPGREVRALAARLAMSTGVFNVLWAVVVVLMIVRPGSTTSA